jgi:hypothetical protein
MTQGPSSAAAPRARGAAAGVFRLRRLATYRPAADRTPESRATLAEGGFGGCDLAFYGGSTQPREPAVLSGKCSLSRKAAVSRSDVSCAHTNSLRGCGIVAAANTRDWLLVCCDGYRDAIHTVENFKLSVFHAFGQSYCLDA